MKSDLVFTTHDGADLHPQSMNNFLRWFCIEHKLPPIGHMLSAHERFFPVGKQRRPESF